MSGQRFIGPTSWGQVSGKKQGQVALDWSSCNYNMVSMLCLFLNYVYICDITTEIQVAGPAVTLHQ